MSMCAWVVRVVVSVGGLCGVYKLLLGIRCGLVGLGGSEGVGGGCFDEPQSG